MIITFFLAVISGMLINNVILMRFLGICPFLGVSKKMESSIGMSIAVSFVLLISSLITYPLYHLILVKAKIEFLDIIAYILVIASIVQILELAIKKYFTKLYKTLGVYLPLITTNCAILGVVQINVPNSSFGETMTNALATGLGFALVMIIFSAIRERLESANVSKSFKGVPISLITAGIMAIAFYGLIGIA